MKSGSSFFLTFHTFSESLLCANYSVSHWEFKCVWESTPVSLKRQLTLIVVSLMLEATQGTIGAHGEHTMPSQHLEEMNSM